MTDEQKALIRQYNRKKNEYAKAEPGCKTGHWESLKDLTKRMLEEGV